MILGYSLVSSVALRGDSDSKLGFTLCLCQPSQKRRDCLPSIQSTGNNVHMDLLKKSGESCVRTKRGIVR